MPRPGYEAEDDAHVGDNELLRRFDPEIRAELMERLNEGSISEAHVSQIYRLISSTPEERDADTIAEILDATAGMESDEFAKWVDDRIARWKDR